MAVDKTKDIQVGGTLHSIATGNIIAHADEVMDEDYGKKQSVINQELSNRLTEELKGYLPLTGGTVTGNITVGNLNNLYTTVSRGDVDLRNNLGDNPAGVLLTSDSDITWQDFGITKQGLNIYDGDKMTQYTNTGVYIGNKTSSDLLNAAGSTTSISDITKDYLPLSGGDVTGKIFSESSIEVGSKFTYEGGSLYTPNSRISSFGFSNYSDPNDSDTDAVYIAGKVVDAWNNWGVVYPGMTIHTTNGLTRYSADGVTIPNKTSSDLLNAGGSTTPISDIVTQVQAAIVDSAPETLDTLNELAAALGDDPNFATTVTNQIASKVDNSKWDTLPNLIITATNAGGEVLEADKTTVKYTTKGVYKNSEGYDTSETTFTKTIPAATSTTAGVLTAEDFKKLSNITLGENGGISGINFNAGPTDSATFSIETEVDDDATTFVFRLTDNIPVQDKIQFRTSEWYNSGVNHYTPVQITDILESRNPTTNKLERVANISELPSVVTTSADGLMSAADKTKLDGIDLSNYVNKSGDTISGNLYFSASVDDRKIRIGGSQISIITPTDEDSWATPYFIVKDQEETNLAIGMGAFGQQNIVKYFYLGGEYNYAVMYVDPNGRRVGIGTSTPSEKLEVSGNVKAEGFIIPDGTANEVLTADGSAISINNLVGSATLLGFTESTESNENLELEATDTINQGFGKLQKAIKDNELVIAEALNSIKDNLGAEDLNAALPDLSTTHYLGSATTFIDCLKALDTKLYEIEQALTLKTV